MAICAAVGVSAISSDCYFFFSLSLQRFTCFNTERRRPDVNVLFDDLSYDVRNAHLRVNNKIKRKFSHCSVYNINIFLSCNENVLRTRENTAVFITLDESTSYGMHSKRVNILYILCIWNLGYQNYCTFSN